MWQHSQTVFIEILQNGTNAFKILMQDYFYKLLYIFQRKSDFVKINFTFPDRSAFEDFLENPKLSDLSKLT